MSRSVSNTTLAGVTIALAPTTVSAILRNNSNSPLPSVWWTSARSAWVARLGMPVRWKTGRCSA